MDDAAGSQLPPRIGSLICSALRVHAKEDVVCERRSSRVFDSRLEGWNVTAALAGEDVALYACCST
jgi:hypothetical protein